MTFVTINFSSDFLSSGGQSSFELLLAPAVFFVLWLLIDPTIVVFVFFTLIVLFSFLLAVSFLLPIILFFFF
jgi:hypothetical protein